MRQYLFQIFFIFLAFVLTSANAAVIRNQDAPENIFTYLHKKYPGAEDITIEQKIHFGQTLYEVKFKENKADGNEIHKQELVKLFRANGRFYTNAYQVERHAFNVIPAEAEQTLKTQYPDYKILSMRMISNPNGVGDEYEIELLVSGNILNITINNSGAIVSESAK